MDQILVSTSNGLFAVDADTGNISHHFEDSVSSVIAPVGAISVSTRIICAAQSAKGLLHFWRIHEGTGAPEGSGNAHYKCAVPEKFSALAFSPCGGLMFAGTASGTVSVWQTWSGKLLKSWVCHFGIVTGIVVSSDCGMLFTSGSDAAVKGFYIPNIWDQVVPGAVIIVSGHSKPVTSMVVNEPAGLLVVASEDPVVKVYSIRDELRMGFNGKSSGSPIALKELHAWQPDNGIPSHVCVSNDGRAVIVACDTGAVYHVEGGSPMLLCQIEERVCGLGLTLDNGRVAVVGPTSGLAILEVMTGTVIHRVIGPSGQMKGALSLVMLRKSPVLIRQDFSTTAVSSWTEPDRWVSAIDSYLQFKPLQRTITPIETIERIPLIMTLAKHAKTKIRANNIFCVDSVTLHTGTADPVAQLQLELAKHKELARVWSRAFAELYARAKAAVPGLDLRVEIPRTEEELKEGLSKRSKRTR